MPIRTHRGRAAVYRRLWGWPLRSPKHLVLAIILLVAVVTGIGLLLPPPRLTRNMMPNASPAYPPATSVAPAPAADSPPTISVPDTTPAVTPPSPQGLAVAVAWGHQWVNHPPGITPQQWLNGLRPMTTPEWITQMQTIDPATVPTAITGPPQPLSSTATSMQVRLPTNETPVQLTLINTPQGWQVAEYD
jgi:hypothetical protein